MTKKDYIAIANAIKNTIQNNWDEGSLPFERKLIIQLCILFKKDNPSFDEDKFISYIYS